MVGETRPDELGDVYPVGEKQPERVRTRNGRALEELTLDNLLAGRVEPSDFGITAEALRLQGEIAERAGRPNLAQNLRRGSELVDVPDGVLLDLYELLRPGRAGRAAELRAAAERLRAAYRAVEAARLFEEAAEVYEQRGLFQRRF